MSKIKNFIINIIAKIQIIYYFGTLSKFEDRYMNFICKYCGNSHEDYSLHYEGKGKFFCHQCGEISK